MVSKAECEIKSPKTNVEPNNHLQPVLLQTIAAQPVWQYPLAVDSVANANPGMPGYLDRFNIRDQKQAGDQFDPAAALRAEETTRTLRNISSASGVNPLVYTLLTLHQIGIQT